MQVSAQFRRAERPQGFTLVELLTVLGVTAILLLLAIPSLNSGFGTAYTSEVTDFASTLVRARAYAMANKTYVFVGIREVNAATSPTATQTAGNGRIGVLVVATNDGSCGYDPTSTTPTLSLSNLTVVAPLRHFDNVHLIALSSAGITALGSTYPITATSGNPVPYYDLTATAAVSKITLNWPLSGSQYSFGSNPGSVIQFDPQGAAQIITGANTNSYLQWIEIDLVPTHGNSVPATIRAQTSILIDGPSGSVSIYRT
jgi:prepilin-type N-terminal cleavage/methylation domain-containing protein